MASHLGTPPECADVYHVYALVPAWAELCERGKRTVLLCYACVSVLVRVHGRACAAVLPGLWGPVLLSCCVVWFVEQQRAALLSLPVKDPPPLDRGCHTGTQGVYSSARVCAVCLPHTLVGQANLCSCLLLVVPQRTLLPVLLQD